MNEISIFGHILRKFFIGILYSMRFIFLAQCLPSRQSSIVDEYGFSFHVLIRDYNIHLSNYYLHIKSEMYGKLIHSIYRCLSFESSVFFTVLMDLCLSKIFKIKYNSKINLKLRSILKLIFIGFYNLPQKIILFFPSLGHN